MNLLKNKDNSQNLKSCPICGSQAIYLNEPFSDKMAWGVICKRTGCLILPALYHSKEIATQVWNNTVEER